MKTAALCLCQSTRLSKPKMSEIEKAEAKLDVEKMIESAIEDHVIKVIG